MQPIQLSRIRQLLAPLVALAFLAATLPGCPAVRGRRNVEHSGFLGDYSRLEEREDSRAREVYVAPDADWSRYDSVVLDSVTLWANEDLGKLSDEERQMLADLLYKGLHQALGTVLKVVERPGVKTLRVRAALTQAKGARVAARTITTFLPQGLLIGTAVGLSADMATTVGEATIEIELVDSVTNRRLAAAVDARAGTKDLLSVRTFQTWGDIEAAAEYWSTGVADFLREQGVQALPAPPEE